MPILGRIATHRMAYLTYHFGAPRRLLGEPHHLLGLQLPPESISRMKLQP